MAAASLRIYEGSIDDYHFALNAEGGVVVSKLTGTNGKKTIVETLTGVETLSFTETEGEFNLITDGDGAGGNDIVVFGADQTATGRGGDDYIYGTSGGDGLFGGNGHDHLYGGDGDDALSGDDGHDRIYGGNGVDAIEGGGGDDKLYGGGGSDTLHGGDGDDFLSGGKGLDFLFGGKGDDKLDGGGGADTAVYYGNVSAYRFTFNDSDSSVSVIDINGQNGDEGRDTLTNIEKLYFADGGYNLVTDGGGTGGNDLFIIHGDGTPTVKGLDGNDYFYASGFRASVDGGAGIDTYAFEGSMDLSSSRHLTNIEIIEVRDGDQLTLDAAAVAATSSQFGNGRGGLLGQANSLVISGNGQLNLQGGGFTQSDREPTNLDLDGNGRIDEDEKESTFSVYQAAHGDETVFLYVEDSMTVNGLSV